MVEGLELASQLVDVFATEIQGLTIGVARQLDVPENHVEIPQMLENRGVVRNQPSRPLPLWSKSAAAHSSASICFVPHELAVYDLGKLRPRQNDYSLKLLAPFWDTQRRCSCSVG